MWCPHDHSEQFVQFIENSKRLKSGFVFHDDLSFIPVMYIKAMVLSFVLCPSKSLLLSSSVLNWLLSSQE